MLKCLFILTVVIAIASSQTWVSRANLKDHLPYWQNMIQELIHELEAREWCNLKLEDITQTFDDNLFNIRVTGTAHYTNGFVVSIQAIDVTDIGQSVDSTTIDGEAIPFGTVRGRLNFRDMVVGHNVYANLTTPAGEYRTTGTFLHTLVQMQLAVTRNLITKEYSSSATAVTASFGSGRRMHYMPSSNITEALSRRYWHSTFESAGNWGANIIAPILNDIATNKLEFPEICINNC